MTRACRRVAGLLPRSLAMTARGNRHRDRQIQLSNSPTCVGRSPHERSDMRELNSRSTSRMSLRSSGLQKSGHTSSPRVLSGSRARRSSLFLFPRRGVRNDRAFHRARGAMCRSTWRRVLESTRQTQPRKQRYACVPHANGLCGLLHVPGVVTGADAPPFVRAVARTCTWTVRPSCRRLSPSAFRVSDPHCVQGSGIVAAIRIPLRVSKTIATRPFGTGWR